MTHKKSAFPKENNSSRNIRHKIGAILGRVNLSSSAHLAIERSILILCFSLFDFIIEVEISSKKF